MVYQQIMVNIWLMVDGLINQLMVNHGKWSDKPAKNYVKTGEPQRPALFFLDRNLFPTVKLLQLGMPLCIKIYPGKRHENRQLRGPFFFEVTRPATSLGLSQGLSLISYDK